jgi:creatinine amidohydrolase
VYATDDTGVGNPKLATAAKGKRFVEDSVQEIATFLKDLDGIEKIEDLYEK